MADVNAQILAKLDEILGMMRTLVQALADGDDEDQPALTLDGEPAGNPRDPRAPL